MALVRTEYILRLANLSESNCTRGKSMKNAVAVLAFQK
jgi:hypothetical protein